MRFSLISRFSSSPKATRSSPSPRRPRSRVTRESTWRVSFAREQSRMQVGQMRRALGDAIFPGRLPSCNRPMKVAYHARRSRGPSSTLSGSETMADAINGRWSYSVGERGRNRVRAFAHAETGRMHLEFYEPARTGDRPKVRRLALGHSDKELAKEAAEKLAAELRSSAPPATAKLKLVTLFDMYLREVTPGKSA